MYFKQIPVGPMGNLSYLIGDEASKEAAVVDPGFDSALIKKTAAQDGFVIKKVLLTHAHYDHSDAVKDFDCQVYVHANEDFDGENIIDNQEIMIGGVRVKVIETPGHTKGGVCFLVENRLITGDTLFVNGFGRTDFPGGDLETLKESLNKLMQLPEDTIVYPGHDYGGAESTIEKEKQSVTNAFG